MITLHFSCQAVYAQEFVFKHNIGDKFRIISTVNEDVFEDGRLIHHSEIVERTASEVLGVAGGQALHKATFQSAEVGTGTPDAERFVWDEEYEATFSRDSQGKMTVRSEFIRPMTRNVPYFPKGDIKIGQKWQAPGEEVHDMRESLGMKQPLRIPFTADYTYIGSREWKGKRYPAFRINYDINYKPKSQEGGLSLITEVAEQTLYWDTVIGQAVACEEEFTLKLSLANGKTYEFRAKGIAEITHSEVFDKTEALERIASELEELPGVEVKKTDEGVMLTLEDIQFYPDSDKMLPGEDAKLVKIGEILKKFAGRDLLVEGHSALAGGSRASQTQLSLERAGTVADFFIEKGVRAREHIVIRGAGAEKPAASNATDEGRRKNRRVEVTILEN
jgi:outer membrane protein OmpA-like peptidoglycan-associated protein